MGIARLGGHSDRLYPHSSQGQNANADSDRSEHDADTAGYDPDANASWYDADADASGHDADASAYDPVPDATSAGAGTGDDPALRNRLGMDRDGCSPKIWQEERKRG